MSSNGYDNSNKSRISGNGQVPVFRTFQRRNMNDIPGFGTLSPERRRVVDVVSRVLPFKTNSYVCEQLIDWSNIPADPIFQLTFPQEEMLAPEHFSEIAELVDAGVPADQVDEAARKIQRKLNPHPSGQVEMNVPKIDGEPLPGMQHKYAETVLFFPSQGQTCHAYCTYCFRWPQFVKLDDLKFATKEGDKLVSYLRAHPEVTDVLFTGGDPMIMRTAVLRRYIEPLLAPEFERLTIRIGTKAVAYWPHRFVDDKDSTDTLRLFEEIVEAGRHLAIMGHYSHPSELATPVAQKAVRNILSTGAVIRCQAPLIKHVNDDSDAWAEMIRLQVKLGCVPYYMFVERDTGAKRYFELPLDQALTIYNKAYQKVSGLGRTIRGPVMSATPGKVLVTDVTEVNGEKVFALRLVQGRKAEWTNRLFFAAYDPTAVWWGDLKPASFDNGFFFDDELHEMHLAAIQKGADAVTKSSVKLTSKPLTPAAS